MKRLGIAALVGILALVACFATVLAQSAPEFKLGFKALADQIPDVVGTPLENERWGSNGDSLQQTTTGLMAWRKADNWTAFTNGAMTWINGPAGVQARPNDQRFDWEAQAQQSDVVDCGTDLGCFIEASRTGRLAKVDYTMAVDFFGMFLANTDALAIKGKDGDKLLFSQKTIAADAALTQAIVAAAKAKGMSDAEVLKALTTAEGIAELMQAANANVVDPKVEQQLNSAKENQRARIGIGKECSFPQAALTAMLERWQKGRFSSSDWDPAECTDTRP